ncbi:hypothetical protein PsorP6_005044 [Peronosclerospora sorghi]|uniref:Uncharacterized protein n=1 Tax=Peronosclerospora sorghi TaxID=230839 RepID=A0ACC0W5V5_9STRA|nr:hypothetical protein PsorP6_005044 [Peronosclerospora sorghi]
MKRILTSYSQKRKNLQCRGKLMDFHDFEGLLRDKRLVERFFLTDKLNHLLHSYKVERSEMRHRTPIMTLSTPDFSKL